MAPPETLYQQLTRRSPTAADHSTLLIRLGDMHRQRGEYTAAESAYAAALALRPADGPALLGMGLLALTLGRPDAVDWFARAADAFGADDPLFAAIARGNQATAALSGPDADPEAAEGLIRTALSMRREAGLPDDPLLLCNLGRCRSLQGDAMGALDCYANARAHARDNLPALGIAAMLHGEALADAGQTDAAEAALQIALTHLSAPPHRLRVRLALAAVAHQRDDLVRYATLVEDALPDLRRHGAPSQRVDTLITLGGVQYLRKDVVTALERLEEAGWEIDTLPPNAERTTRLQINRGLARLAVGRLDDARTDLEAACDALRARSDLTGLVQQLRALVDLHRYNGDLRAAIATQAELAGLEGQLQRLPEEGEMLYSAVEDRSLNLSTAAMRRPGPAPGQGPVLLLAPPAYGATGPLFPRGAASIASFLQANGVPAQVLPLAGDPNESTDQALHRIEAAITDALDALRPRAVGLSVTFSYLYPHGQQIAKMVRRHAPATPILIGGPHVTYQDRQCLEETPEIDVVVRGEGEWTALALLDALAHGRDLGEVEGITWRTDRGEIVRNKKRTLGSVAELPPIDFSLLPAAFCHVMDISALTSRGCSFRCKFCHEFRYWGGVVREHTVARITDEMDALAKYGNHLQGIDDSMLDMRTPFFAELIDALEKSPHVTPNFGLLTRLDTITAEGSRAMKRAGIRWVAVGAESGSQVVLDAMNKGLKVEQTRKGLEIAKAAGLSTSAFFILGHPGDNVEQSAVTEAFVHDLFQDGALDWIDISTFTPYPGTPFYNSAKLYGVEILTRDWAKWRRTNRPVAQLKNYAAADIYLALLRMLAVQDDHLKQTGLMPPPLGSGSGVG
ncbi:MAG: radical SAM protein [Myxococcota bacterium]